jgi:hypothetical protein
MSMSLIYDYKTTASILIFTSILYFLNDKHLHL